MLKRALLRARVAKALSPGGPEYASGNKMAVRNRVRPQLLIDLIRLAPRSPGNHARHTERRQIANGEMDASVDKIGKGIIPIAISALHAKRVVGHRIPIAIVDLGAPNKNLAVFRPHRVIKTKRR